MRAFVPFERNQENILSNSNNDKLPNFLKQAAYTLICHMLWLALMSNFFSDRTITY